MKKLTLPLLILILLSSCSPGPQEVVNSWQAALNEGKVDKALSYLAEDATVTIQPPAEGDGVYSGQAEIRGWYESMVSAKGSGALSDCRLAAETLTCFDTYTDEGLKGLGVEFIEGEFVAEVHDGKIQSYTFTMSPESLAKFPAPEPVEAPAASSTELLGVWWFPQAGMMLEIKADNTYRVFSGPETIDAGEYSYDSGKITWLTSTGFCRDHPTATYEAYLLREAGVPAKLRMQVVGSDGCFGRASTADGIGKFQNPPPAASAVDSVTEGEVRITSPEVMVGNWKGKSGDYVVLHQFGADGRLVVNVSGAGVIGTGPYVFEDRLLKFQDATGDCAGMVGRYEVYGIYEENRLVRLRFAMDDTDPCRDRMKTLDGKFLTPD